MKLKSLVFFWYSQLENKQITEEALVKYIHSNSRCKLPWSVQEINKAIASTQNLFHTKLL